MDNLTIYEYFEHVNTIRLAYPNWRYGQTLFNVLAVYRPDLASKIIGTKLDPFHAQEKDSVILEFTGWLINMLGEENA